eukprot:8098026-Pyramimonas_sp.AAC.1
MRGSSGLQENCHKGHWRVNYIPPDKKVRKTRCLRSLEPEVLLLSNAMVGPRKRRIQQDSGTAGVRQALAVEPRRGLPDP